MNKSYKYTILTLAFALVFAFGSMAGMNLIMRAKERQFLTESGRAVVELPVREWEGRGDRDKNGAGTDDGVEKNFLTVRQMEEAVMSWNTRIGETLHDPVAGQISMEEAIENGKGWLSEMGMVEEMDGAVFSVSAKLGVGEPMGDAGERLEAYFSFWTVTYSNQAMHAVLYLNAVTGKVWGANIRRYEELPKKLYDDSLQLFVELAGLQAAEDVPSITDFQELKSVVAIKESQLLAQKVACVMATKFEDTYEYITYQLLVKHR